MLSMPDGMLTALSQPESTQTITGSIKLGDGTTQDIPAASLLAGSTTISMQCGETGEVHIGGAYIGEMKTTILHPSFDRTLLRNATVTLTAGVNTPTGMQNVQLGVWTVSSASWSRTGVELTCYDHMAKLDGGYTGTGKTGTPYQWLTRACQACGLTLGTSERDIQLMPNGLGSYTLTDTTNVKTWRDLVQWVCQLLAGFAYAGADGSITVARYAATPCRTIPGEHRTQDTTLEAYEAAYTGITLTLTTDGLTEYHTRDPKTDTGLTQNLGQNPLLQDLGKTVRHDRLLRIIDAIPPSTPGSITIMEPPVHTLGDMLTLTGGYTSTTGVSMLVQRVEYQSGKGTTYTGYGADPALASARSKTDKNVEGLLAQTKADEWNSTPFGVNKTITIGSDRTLVATVSFAVKDKDTIVDVHAQTLLDITLPTPIDDGTTTTFTPTILTCAWVLDGVEYTDFHPTETYTAAGRHVLHLYLAPKATANLTHRLDLYMQATGGSCTIQSGGLMGLLEGKGLAGDAGWNGRIDIDETTGLFGTNITAFQPRALADSAGATIITPAASGVTDTVTPLRLDQVGYLPAVFTGLPGLHPGSEAVDWLHAAIESYDKTQGEWVGNLFQATKQATLASWLMGTDQTITGITSITPVDAPDTATYQLSWDGGKTWGAVDDHGTWTVDATMTGSRMAALDRAQYATWYTPDTGVMVRVTLPAGTTIRQIIVTYTTFGGFQ
ncbi:MAG: hypothetical protein MR570_06570 [Bifidobacterium pseudolongum]|nr:hypothetical protein [Bifidobacterium pseudolongum]